MYLLHTQSRQVLLLSVTWHLIQQNNFNFNINVANFTLLLASTYRICKFDMALLLHKIYMPKESILSFMYNVIHM